MDRKSSLSKILTKTRSRKSKISKSITTGRTSRVKAAVRICSTQWQEGRTHSSSNSKRSRTSLRRWLWILYSFGICNATWGITLSITLRSTILTGWFSLRRTRQERGQRTWFSGHLLFTRQQVHWTQHKTSRWRRLAIQHTTSAIRLMRMRQMRSIEREQMSNYHVFHVFDTDHFSFIN